MFIAIRRFEQKTSISHFYKMKNSDENLMIDNDFEFGCRQKTIHINYILNIF